MSAAVIAIDGPSASGKSTVAKRVAGAMGYLYVDSGSLYRGITWRMMELKVDAAVIDSVKAALERIRMEFFVADGAVRFKVDGYEPVSEIRSEAVNGQVSRFAAIPEVRRLVVARLREMAKMGDLVIEGRDIGTAVFPNARFKFYLDASPAERAKRRLMEMAEKSSDLSENKVGESLKKRDKIDSSRHMDPLKIAEGATVLDSTGMEIQQVVDLILTSIGRNMEVKK